MNSCLYGALSKTSFRYLSVSSCERRREFWPFSLSVRWGWRWFKNSQTKQAADGCRKMRGIYPKQCETLPFLLMQWQPLVSRGLVTYRLFCWLWRLLFAGRSNIWFYVSRLDFFSPIPLAFCFPLCYLPLLKLKGLRNSCCCPWDVEHFYWQQDFKCSSPVIVSCSVWLFCLLPGYESALCNNLNIWIWINDVTSP